ncbi:MAG: hypothetical protein ACHREM_22505 [Polyangiales bacterium]
MHLSAFATVLVPVAIGACNTPPLSASGASCERSSDCTQGLVCVNRVCSTAIDQIDGGSTPDLNPPVDAADAETTRDATAESAADSATTDTAPADTSSSDTSAPDLGPADTGAPDTAVVDLGVVDTSPPDETSSSEPADETSVDAGVSD